jgi:phosphoribosylanthranilate isomerase
MPTRVKICCISSEAEADLAVRRGASAVGLVSSMPSGPGPIPEERIKAIASLAPPGVATFLLTSRIEPDEIVEQWRRCRTQVLQLVDRLPAGALLVLRRRLPGVKLVPVVHVRGEESVAEAARAAQGADALLLDSGNPELPVKELGGTGRTHDWALSRRIVRSSPIPVFLAGGLNSENVGDAIRRVRPFGVDVCSGVRSEGRLDDLRLTAFVRSIRETDRVLDGE